MATAKKPAQGAWKTKTVHEFKVEGTAAVWRSQISTAPDGKRFVGVRKYFVKKDGTERADRAGMSILLDDNLLTTMGQLKQIQGLFRSLQTALDDIQSGGDSTEAPAKKTKSAKADIQELGPPSDAVKGAAAAKRRTKAHPKGPFALFKGEAYLVKCVKNADTGRVAVAQSNNPTKAKIWPSEEEAQAYLVGRPKSLNGFEICSLA